MQFSIEILYDFDYYDRMKQFFIIIIICFFIFSCGKPPELLGYTTFFQLVGDFIEKLYLIKDDKEARKAMREESNTLQLLLEIKKNDQLILKSHEAVAKENSIGRTLDNSTYQITKDVYITQGKKNEMLFSFDNIDWYSNQDDVMKNVENIIFDYQIKYKTQGQTITVDYEATLDEGKQKLVVQKPKNREVVNLKKKMILITTEKTKEQLDLNKQILFLKAGTKLGGRLLLEGNLATATTDDGQLTLTFSRDMYIYLNKKLVSLSFDKKKWGLSLLSLKINPEVEITANDEEYIYFDMKLTLNYDNIPR